MFRSALSVCAFRFAAGSLLFFLSLAIQTQAADAKLTVAAAEPPKEIAEPIRAALEPKALKLANGAAPFFEFWFRKELVLGEAPTNGSIDVNTIQEGTVIGAVKVDVQRDDFRKEEIPPGVYVIRYGLQPEDGNHQGSAPTRSFALLISAKTDTKLDPLKREDLLKQAAGTNAAKHPSNFNLQPNEKLDGEFPRLGERNDGEHKVIELKLPGKVGADGKATTVSFCLVYEGFGHI